MSSDTPGAGGGGGADPAKTIPAPKGHGSSPSLRWGHSLGDFSRGLNASLEFLRICLAVPFKPVTRSKKKHEDLVEYLRTLRKDVRKRVEEELIKEYEDARREGKYPWEGLWLERQQIERLIRRMEWRDKIAFLEVLVVFLLIGMLSIGLYWFMKVFFLPI